MKSKVIGNGIFTGVPEDVNDFQVRVAWTTDPRQAVKFIREGLRVIIPEEGWEQTATAILRGLGQPETWIDRCIWMAAHREELLSQRGGVIPGMIPP
jgi:hypothetical protein